MRKRDEEQILDSLLNDVRDDTRLTRVDVQSGDMGKAFADALAQAEDISSRFTDRKMKVGDTRVELTDKGVPFLHDRRRDEALWFSPWAFAQFGISWVWVRRIYEEAPGKKGSQTLCR